MGGRTFKGYVEKVKWNIMVDCDSRSAVDTVSGGIRVDQIRLLVFEGDLDFRTTAEVEVHHFESIATIAICTCCAVYNGSACRRACIYTRIRYRAPRIDEAHCGFWIRVEMNSSQYNVRNI